MIEISRKKVESLLRKNFSFKILVVRNSKKHEGHGQVAQNPEKLTFLLRWY